jgi:threonine/homoserine/homoserine lactone efflux protein
MDYISFFAFAFIASVTPGPNNIILTTVGSQVGIGRGLPALVGTAMGFGLMLFIVGISLGTTINENETILIILRFLGVGAILWLAFSIATAPIKDQSLQDSKALSFGFGPALLFQWVNPKAWIVSVSIVGTFMDTEISAIQQASALSAVFVCAALLGCFPWLAFGSSMRAILRNPVWARCFNLLLGVGLALTVFTLL